jgi:checkpoint serine/threonine-protein kinase
MARWSTPRRNRWLVCRREKQPSLAVRRYGRYGRRRRLVSLDRKWRCGMLTGSTVKTRLESPSGKKLKRKGSAEPTMTFHSKAATNEIYDMFNESSKPADNDDTQSGNETDYDDDTYSTAGESTGTGRISTATSEFGDETLARVAAGGSLDNATQSSQPTSVSPWSEFTTSKHVPKVERGSKLHKHSASDDLTDQLDSQNQTQTSGMDSFDTQAIAAIANQNFDEMKTQDIARLAGGMPLDEDEEEVDMPQRLEESDDQPFDALTTPVETDNPFEDRLVEVQEESRYVPIAPEDYEPTPLRPYRDATVLAQNKLPFMTPIAEQTESSIGSTAYRKTDYSKTPSRKHGADTFESPSKLHLEELAMSSPQRPSTSGSDRPDTPKRRLETIDDGEDWIPESPAKKLQRSLLDDDEGGVPLPAPPIGKNFILSQMPAQKEPTPEPAIPGKPIINDSQCNPISEEIRNLILCSLVTPITDYPGYSESPDETFAHLDALKTFTKSVKVASKSPRKSMPANGKSEPRLNFESSSRVYAVRRELGTGAYATAYLASSTDKQIAANSLSQLSTTTPTSSPRKSLSRSVSPQIDPTTGRADQEAIKAESTASSGRTVQFEFHIIRLAHSRLLSSNPRAAQSIITAHECHLYRDESYLILTYSPQGTILDLLNASMTDAAARGKPCDGVGLDEPLAMFFCVEVLRTMEALHSVGILHGDLKADNCLVRFDLSKDLAGPYSATGDSNWSARGITLIDFGRGIDTRCFLPSAKFIADWDPSAQDCPEIQEARPWKWSLDFYGAAGIVHSLLFGKYLSTITVPVLTENESGIEGQMTLGIKSRREVRVKEMMKRYMSKDVWNEVFHVLLNKGSEDDAEVRMGELKRVRELMEDWLETEGEKRDLRGKVRKAEGLVLARK